MYYHLLFTLGISIVGVIALLLSRSMNTIEEDEQRGDNWIREMLSGPPGYRRAGMALLGIILIIFGAVGVFRLLFLSLY
jgi:hypothetical protein